MPTKPLDRLMFSQGGQCFFCREPLSPSDASVEHLVASANGGSNGDDNCVACCKALNRLFGSMSLKEKIRVVLDQKGHFKCPNKAPVHKAATVSVAVVRTSRPQASASPSEKIVRIIHDLQKMGSAKPRTLKRLSSAIGALFQKKVSEQEILSLIERLRTEGLIVVAGEKVSYELPTKVA